MNIRNLVYQLANKNTLEVRNLPATLDSRRIFAAIDALQVLFAYTLDPTNWRAELELPVRVPELLNATQT